MMTGAMVAPLVLLPPSESKVAGGTGRWDPAAGRFPGLAGRRAAAVAALAAPAAAPLLGVRGELLERATAALRAADAGEAPALPAWRRYTGVVWVHLDPATLRAADRRRIVVPSAVMGLAAGDDPVPDYRGKLSVRVPGLGRLDRWWRDEVTDALLAARRPIVDLLAAEQASAVDWDRLGAARRVTRIRFLAAGGGGAAGHAAKAVKGIAARLVLTGGPDALEALDWAGWTARPSVAGWEVVATPP
jgi:cytoplasmic iron level regulating protein YaaA (DUF328/UPF0246 family)